MNSEQREEGKIPVQGRVNVVDLAELVTFFEDEGVIIKSVSQLLGDGIALLVDILHRNEKISTDVTKIVDAHKMLRQRGLYQSAMGRRAFQKVGTAIRFESMREEGINPKEYVPEQYKMLHRKDEALDNERDEEYWARRLEKQKDRAEQYADTKKVAEEAIKRMKEEGTIK